jgi:hypothetical protein
MYPRTHLLGLPRELRDNILKTYVKVEGGYKYNFHSGKLNSADDQPIDLALMLTCRLIAVEMKGLAFSLNSITFYTVYSDDMRIPAGQYEALLEDIHNDELHLLRNNIEITEDHVNWTDSECPQFLEQLKHLQLDPFWYRPPLDYSAMPNEAFGETPSLFRQFVHRMLQLTHNLNDPAKMDYDAHALVSLRYVPWQVPTAADNEEIVKVFGPATYSAEPGFFDTTDKTMFRISAAAAAVHFLQSIAKPVREQLRQIVVFEDHPSVAYPECHAQGLIPFCQENPFLHVERQVSLWRNIFLRNGFHNTLAFRAADYIYSGDIARSIALWIVEADALESIGMPVGSFSLTLDGDVIPEHTTKAFKVIQDAAAWQTALDEAYKRQITPQPSYLARRKRGCYLYEAFPRLIREIIAGTSIIRCNFDPGELVDPEQILKKNRHWDAIQWQEAAPPHDPWKFDTVPPLPSYKEIVSENILPSSNR